MRRRSWFDVKIDGEGEVNPITTLLQEKVLGIQETISD